MASTKNPMAARNSAGVGRCVARVLKQDKSPEVAVVNIAIAKWSLSASEEA